MKVRHFLISSLAVAGILPAPTAESEAHAQSIGEVPRDTNNLNDAIIDQFANDHAFELAGHSSHSSHASHSSHRSSSGGSYDFEDYTPAESSPAPPLVSVAPRPATLPSSSSDGFVNIVSRVQRGLIAFGYYDGQVDGVVGPQTRAALQRFQADYNLKVTGTVTPQVLGALGISSP